jgi:hypothetical protein
VVLKRYVHWPVIGMLALLAACGGDDELAPCAPPPEPAVGPPFIDATSALGINADHHPETDFCELPDSGAGPGVCLLDVDDDGDLDIYFVDRAGFDNRMYQNDGATFSEMTAESGAALQSAQSMGCLAFDYDLDGDTDIYVTNLGPDVLLENNGGVFSDVTSDVGIAADGFSVSATAGDMDLDGDLDLFVGRVVKYETCPVGCELSPLDCEPAPNLLFENRGGSFVEVALERGIDDLAPTLAPLFFDFDVDGDLDLYVGNDIGLIYPDRLYINDGSGNFVDRAEEKSMHGPGTDTMGVDVGDYDGDGMLDMVVSDFDMRPIRLFRCFDTSLPCSNEVAPDGTNFVKWAVAFEDFDNDADLDLFVTTGDVVPSSGQRSYLYFGDGSGLLDEYIPPDDLGVGQERVSRGAAFGDLDNDGDVDVVIANAGDAHQVLLNQSGAGHWLYVELGADKAGAMVTVSSEHGTLKEQLVIGGSFASTNDRRMHFGLGDACRATVTVRHLDGSINSKQAVAGQTVSF